MNRSATRPRVSFAGQPTPLLLVLVAGCWNGSGLVPVTGTVSLDGQPVDAAQLSIIPASGAGKAGFAVTQADGSFEALVRPGRYRITVFKPVYDRPERLGQSAVPELYRDFTSTPLEHDIQASTTVELRLTTSRSLSAAAGAAPASP